MPNLRTHTLCQVAQMTNSQVETCQRVWLRQHTDRLRRIKHENTTSYIKFLTESINIEVSTLNNKSNGKAQNHLKRLMLYIRDR